MIPYSQFRPTAHDCAGLGLDDRQAWLVLTGVGRTRDSGCLSESNFHCAIEALGGEGDDVEIHRFGHWGPGWFEIILVRPDSAAAIEAERIESAVADYPILDDDDFARREQEEADRVWADCYSVKDRIDYVQEHRYQFEFRSFADMLGCIRGRYFAGYASELIT